MVNHFPVLSQNLDKVEFVKAQDLDQTIFAFTVVLGFTQNFERLIGQFLCFHRIFGILTKLTLQPESIQVPRVHAISSGCGSFSQEIGPKHLDFLLFLIILQLFDLIQIFTILTGSCLCCLLLLFFLTVEHEGHTCIIFFRNVFFFLHGCSVVVVCDFLTQANQPGKILVREALTQKSGHLMLLIFRLDFFILQHGEHLIGSAHQNVLRLATEKLCDICQNELIVVLCFFRLRLILEAEVSKIDQDRGRQLGCWLLLFKGLCAFLLTLLQVLRNTAHSTVAHAHTCELTLQRLDFACGIIAHTNIKQFPVGLQHQVGVSIVLVLLLTKSMLSHSCGSGGCSPQTNNRNKRKKKKIKDKGS
eukprot:m.142888 g.142888  ORF g.142888 m.142888 type:complete len:360 (+) comp16005_c1_seq1:5598-6677(+)